MFTEGFKKSPTCLPQWYIILCSHHKGMNGSVSLHSYQHLVVSWLLNFIILTYNVVSNILICIFLVANLQHICLYATLCVLLLLNLRVPYHGIFSKMYLQIFSCTGLYCHHHILVKSNLSIFPFTDHFRCQLQETFLIFLSGRCSIMFFQSS